MAREGFGDVGQPQEMSSNVSPKEKDLCLLFRNKNVKKDRENISLKAMAPEQKITYFILSL